MVTFEPAGRLGNWMLEFFCAAAYAFRHNLEFTVPKQGNRDKFWNPCYAEWLVNHNYNESLERIDLWENGHHYQELPFEEEWRNKNIVVQGYRQSFKYCDDYREAVLSLLNDNWQLKKRVIAIHIRLGDYKSLTQKHILYNIEYMRKATSFFYNKGYDHFKVYSDEINWCREEFSKPDFSAFNIEFSTNTNEWDDMMDMAKCEHHINSSSTFSLCAAYINRNPNKIVITPEHWFVPGWMNMETKDIIPSTWIKM